MTMAKIKFVVSEEQVGKAYWLARDGTEQAEDFKSALKLVMEKKRRYRI